MPKAARAEGVGVGGGCSSDPGHRSCSVTELLASVGEQHDPLDLGPILDIKPIRTYPKRAPTEIFEGGRRVGRRVGRHGATDRDVLVRPGAQLNCLRLQHPPRY